MREHISGQYDNELGTIRAHLTEMAGLVERQLEHAGTALLQQAPEHAEEVIRIDADVNRLEVVIDDLCSHIIVRRQPTASDLRFIMVTLKAITDLERIGDECSRIAKMATDLASRERVRERFTEFDDMTSGVTGMLRDALHAFFRVDTESAADVIARDKAVDRSYKAVIARLIPKMEQEPEALRALLDLVWCARSLERIGDHAKNIAEYVIYLGHGQDIRHQPLETKQREAQNENRSS
ncbi:MAG: phosphate signaling complex protein PhoU [Gammaproteobacteria bacterium]|nr:phosphate signaling complex protein PhoU [Gammaproteobacteria bacterium]